MAVSYEHSSVIKAMNCLERAASIILEASQYPHSRVNQCPILKKTAEAEMEAAITLLEKAKFEG